MVVGKEDGGWNSQCPRVVVMVRKEAAVVGGRQVAAVEANSARGPCAHCGALVVAVAPPPAQGQQQLAEKPKSQVHGQEAAYIKSLQQQIKILELEVAYLKRQPSPEKEKLKEGGKEERVGGHLEGKKDAPAGLASGQGPAVKELQAELQLERTRVEQLRIEKGKASERLRQAETWREEEKDKAVAVQAKLEGRLEDLEREEQVRETRLASISQDLERQTMVSRDRERQVVTLQEEVQAAKEEVGRAGQQVEQLQCELASRQAAVQTLQEKFLQSSQHILQETVKGLQEEVKVACTKVRELELAADDARGQRDRWEVIRGGLTEELGEVRAELARVKSELEGEVRTREHRDNRMSLDSQEVTMLREKEQQLRGEVNQLQKQVEKQGERLKAVQERLTGEQHQVTSQELKLSTMKSRIAELEGSLSLSSEQSTALRRNCLAQTEKVETVRREAEQWRGEATQMATRLAESQASLGEVEDGSCSRCVHSLVAGEADRKVAALQAAQSARWEEFCRMADRWNI